MMISTYFTYSITIYYNGMIYPLQPKVSARHVREINLLADK